jgi:hypothetical protein
MSNKKTVPDEYCDGCEVQLLCLVGYERVEMARYHCNHCERDYMAVTMVTSDDNLRAPTIECTVPGDCAYAGTFRKCSTCLSKDCSSYYDRRPIFLDNGTSVTILRKSED